MRVKNWEGVGRLGTQAWHRARVQEFAGGRHVEVAAYMKPWIWFPVPLITDSYLARLGNSFDLSMYILHCVQELHGSKPHPQERCGWWYTGQGVLHCGAQTVEVPSLKGKFAFPSLWHLDNSTLFQGSQDNLPCHLARAPRCSAFAADNHFPL